MVGSARNRFALVTGASSGLGIDFARGCAARGYDLVLAARRADKLQELAERLRQEFACRIEVIAVDLSQEGERERLAREIESFELPLEVLINNAGLGLFGKFEAIPWAEQRQMLDVDITAVVHLSKLFLPAMLAKRAGYILNVASVGAYQPTPLYASYSAAKAFVLSFSEALKFELRGTGVSVTVVSPGVTATEFLSVAKQRATPYQRGMMMRSADVVDAALKALFAGRSSIVPGRLNAMMALGAKMLPGPLAARMAHTLMKER